MAFKTYLIPTVQARTEGVIPRGNLLNDIIRRVNVNTLAIRPPRMADEDDQIDGAKIAAQYREEEDSPNTVDGTTSSNPSAVEDVSEELQPLVLTEQSRQTSLVTVEDPNDPDVSVDVDRIDSVVMLGSDGRTYTLTFTNS